MPAPTSSDIEKGCGGHYWAAATSAVNDLVDRDLWKLLRRAYRVGSDKQRTFKKDYLAKVPMLQEAMSSS